MNKTLSDLYDRAYRSGQKEYRQFILNLLNGQDIADKQMGYIPSTKALRFAIQSKVIKEVAEGKFKKTLLDLSDK